MRRILSALLRKNEDRKCEDDLHRCFSRCRRFLLMLKALVDRGRSQGQASCPVPRYRVNNTGMRTGELARNAGVNLQTIRFYEREGLLPKPARTVSGYRSYQQSDLERVIFIRKNQQLGFTLAEIKQLMQLHGVLAAMGPKHFR